jgi:AhpD family alkylhydroperoxidase
MLATSDSIWVAARHPPPSASYPVGKHGAMTDHEHYAGVLNELNPQHRALRQVIPDVYKGFGELSRAALAAGAVESKVKELMAMTIGVVLGCDGCIASHARGAVRAGATKQEAAEMIGVSIMMHGGSATIYGARAYAAFCEFADDTAGPSTQQ